MRNSDTESAVLKNVLINTRDYEVKSKWKNNSVTIKCCHSLRLLSYRGEKIFDFSGLRICFWFYLKEFYQAESSLLLFAWSYAGKSKQNYISCLPPRRYYSIKRWTHIVNNDWFYYYSSFKYLSCRQFFEYSVCKIPNALSF